MRHATGKPMSQHGEPHEITDIREYTRETVRQIDAAIREQSERRRELAMRLAVLDAAEDPELARMASEVEELVRAGTGFPHAEPAADVLSEAYRRYVR